jgi:hypothetical protein
MKKTNLQAAIDTLEQLLKSPSRITKKAVKECLATWKQENRKRLTNSMKDAVIQLQRINETQLELMKKRNTKKVIKATHGAVMIDFIERGANIDVPNEFQARAILANNLCLISYVLKNSSQTTGEKAGNYTVRFATRKRCLYTELKASGQAVQNGTIKYYSLSANDWRSCTIDNFAGLVEFPKEITNLFARSSPELRKYYAGVAEKAIRERRAIIEGKDLKVEIA